MAIPAKGPDEYMTADPHAMIRDEAMDHVLAASAETSSDLRRRAASNKGVPDDLEGLVDKIHRHAYKVVDKDLDAAKQRYSEDELFEVIISAALGASRERLTAGLRALEEAE